MIRIPALLWALSAAAAAQTRTAWDGAFTATQADRGRAAYRESCARCHGPDLAGGESTPPLAGSAFLAAWNGKSALDLMERTRRTMPTDNPGGLGSQQYADITAYVLSVNRFRAGAVDLGGAVVPAATRGMSEWRYYGADAAGTKYSPLDRIDASNVSKLHIAWSWCAA
jgi:quinoprotein glucose dehydrogenase